MPKKRFVDSRSLISLIGTKTIQYFIYPSKKFTTTITSDINAKNKWNPPCP